MERVLTTLALFAFAVYAIFFAPGPIFLALAIVLALLCYWEFSELVGAHGFEKPGIPGALLGLTLFYDLGAARLVMLAALVLSLRFDQLSRSLPYAASLIMGAIYIFAAWKCAVDLHALSTYWILFALAVNWVGDILAYYVGRAVGRHKLAPQVSPGKTWEGAAGSMAGALLFGWAFEHWLTPQVPLATILVLAACSNVAGQFGDLAESALKRGAGLKDSGKLLPGHGGLLDRFDSSLFTLPVVYAFLQVSRYLNWGA